MAVVQEDAMQAQTNSKTGRGVYPSRLTRETIASYTTYPEAQRAVDFLSDEKFPVERVAIVAEGIRFVEEVTGRLNWGRALLSGALSGAVVGAFLGFIFGLFGLIDPVATALTLALYGLIFGAITGAIIALVGYAASRGRRDFTSVSGMQADEYAIVVDAEAAEEARQILRRLEPMARAA